MTYKKLIAVLLQLYISVTFPTKSYNTTRTSTAHGKTRELLIFCMLERYSNFSLSHKKGGIAVALLLIL